MRRTLFISQQGALRAARSFTETAAVSHTEVLSGLQKEADGSVSRGWFVKLFPSEGLPYYV